MQCFLRYDTKSPNKQTEKDKLDIVKIKNFLCSKDTISKVKRQPKDCQKIFTGHTSDKGLEFGIYKELLQLNNKEKNNPIKKVGKESE